MRQPADRQRLIRLIHVAKRDLSMDDDTYRAILLRIGKKASSADLTIPELVTSYLSLLVLKVIHIVNNTENGISIPTLG